MPKNFTYTDAGVDREQRHESKKHLKTLEDTYSYSSYGSVRCLPYGNIFPVGKDAYLDLVIEGVGTKVLVAQLAGKYDTWQLTMSYVQVPSRLPSQITFTRKPATPNW